VSEAFPHVTADEFMRSLWLEMRDGAGLDAQATAKGAIAMAVATGAFSADQGELWERRVQTSCPGHDDEGGRDWCAYCGEMNREKGTPKP